MSTDGSREDPTTRPLPQGDPPSPYGSSPYGDGARDGAPYGSGTDRDAQTQPYPLGPGGRRQGRGWRRGRGWRQGRGWRSPAVLVPVAVGALVVLGAGAALVWTTFRGVEVQEAPDGTPNATGQAAQLPPGRTWLSGIWIGGNPSVERVRSFGSWRGQPADVVTTYPAYDTWEEIRTSDWNVAVFDGFRGRLSYGLPLLPSHDEGTLADVAAGKHDDAFRAVADVLNKHDRGDSFVRIGLEANGNWFPWGAGADEAEDFKAAWRHVQGVLKQASPNLVFGFDIGCGTSFQGGSDRLDGLTKLYPGDDVVDVVGCDRYDQYHVKARNQQEWDATLRPSDAPGLADVADFARAHGKKLAVPEWGVVSQEREGSGDNPFFIYAMYSFFLQNKDIMAYENYFNEPSPDLGSSLWEDVQNPRSAAEYKKLWGAAPNLATTDS